MTLAAALGKHAVTRPYSRPCDVALDGWDMSAGLLLQSNSRRRSASSRVILFAGLSHRRLSPHLENLVMHAALSNLVAAAPRWAKGWKGRGS